MSVAQQEFISGMRRLGGAVTIVATANEGVRAGLTATAVTSLSADPPRLLACINKQGSSYDILSKGRCLSVNVLGTQHLELAQDFAGLNGHGETERFDSATGLWAIGKSGAPYLKDALVSFDCDVSSILDHGSHAIVIGNVLDVHLPGGAELSPLCYIDGAWSTLVPIKHDAL